MNTIDDSLNKEGEGSPYRENSGERVVVILDVRNVTCRQSMEYSNTRMDYSKLLRDTTANRQCVVAIAVDGVTYDERGRDVFRIFHSELKGAGFRTVLVPASNNKGKQEGVDVKIALLAQKYALLNKCDIVELITGDGDFTVLVQDLQEEGVRVNVTSFSANLSYSLKDKADEVRILDDIPLVKMQQKSIEEGC
ncbi:NYN domain-containing protein [Candidatus Methanarcanum hacksteinii]|uniref:NYN domain-containing protein n=1 Tax=Candidatus Methanarcanum hacksteinii TaxID=2911857 RepID=UPI0037DC476B